MPLPENAIDSPKISSLSDVPEDALLHHPSPSPRSPYLHSSMTGSTSTFNKAAAASSSSLTSVSSSSRQHGSAPRTPSTLARTATSKSAGEVGSTTTNGSSSTRRSGSPATLKEKDKDRRRERRARDKEGKGSKREPSTEKGSAMYKIRLSPQLMHSKDVDPAPATLMYWSLAPVFGTVPAHGVRAHSVTLVDSVAWLFGGCDERGCWKDVFCFHTESMEWSHPETIGDVPPPCRAHTATLVDRRIVIIGGGEGPAYYNDVYILDTFTRRWAHPTFPADAPVPPPRRAHTAVLYKNKIWVFGGGNGMEALNDVWTLDVGVHVDKMKWEQVETRGRKPTARGYHTANLVGNVMVVMGGSDGRECFSDIWCLNLDTLLWSIVTLDVSYRRLSHTATQVGSYLFIMGGHDGSQYTSDLLLFNLVSLNFEIRPTAGTPPAPRGYHVAFLSDSRLFVFGGFNGNEVYDDVHLLELAGAAYLPQVTSFRIDVD
ncbi:hypothetical protein BKA93DRAFT_762123 [Sparassis latifolia]|uniref:Galactose oxidase n=1 Tax=Sparassis crispa TaxID=139825 RepID=A0A401GXY9_9APHY|nr:hypothetical protein SCP_1003350 [Sparassis crispa]GBE87088.1 hypothetical protein SCP_1003350 [Sparassis crispa]